VLARLAETPPGLAALTAGLNPALLQASPAPDEWSANDVLAHLRACADVWGGYIMRILAEDRPAFRAVSPRTWIEQTNYPDLDFGPSLRAFATQRAELLTVLEPLPTDAWIKTALVTGAGKPLERTVLSYAERLTIHERPHVKQVAHIVTTLAEAHESLQSAS
jgi:hypothetical protein